MPEGARTGEQQQQERKAVVYVGTMQGLEIAAAGLYAEFGVPLEVPNRSRVVRHVLDEHGNRYQDVRYPGLADQLLQRPDFIEAGEIDKAKPGVSFDQQPAGARKAVEEHAEQVRRLEAADTRWQRLALEQAEPGEQVDEIVQGGPGYIVVEPGTPLPGPGAETAPTDPTVVRDPGRVETVPNPPVDLQPAAPGDQTGVDPDAETKEGDADTDTQQQPGRARPRAGSRTATRRG